MATLAAVVAALYVAHTARGDTHDALAVAHDELRAALKPRLSMASEPSFLGAAPQRRFTVEEERLVVYIARVTNVGNGAALLDPGRFVSGSAELLWTPDPSWLAAGATGTLTCIMSFGYAPGSWSRGWVGAVSVRYTDIRGEQCEVLVMDCPFDMAVTASITACVDG